MAPGTSSPSLAEIKGLLARAEAALAGLHLGREAGPPPQRRAGTRALPAGAGPAGGAPPRGGGAGPPPAPPPPAARVRSLEFWIAPPRALRAPSPPPADRLLPRKRAPPCRMPRAPPW